MATYNTGNPVGSSDPRDLFDNAEALDHWINDLTVDHWNDRLGVERWTWRGIENRFEGAMQDWDQRFSLALANVGYVPIGEYDNGPLIITEYNQIFLQDGSWWKPASSLSLPYTTIEDWPNDVDNFVSVSDATLRDDLAAAGGVGLVGDALDARENLADIADPAEARANLGLENVVQMTFPSGSQGRIPYVNPGESGLATAADYVFRSATVNLSGSGDFTGGQISLRRVGNIVFAVMIGAQHSSSSEPSTAPGVLPEGFGAASICVNNVLTTGYSINVHLNSDSSVSLSYYDTTTGDPVAFSGPGINVRPSFFYFGSGA